MIGFFIIFALCAFVFQKFSQAAFDNDRPRIGFGFAGVGFFIAIFFLFQFIAGIIIGLFMPALLSNIGVMLVLGFLSYGVGVFGAILVLNAFKKSWAKTPIDRDLLDN